MPSTRRRRALAILLLAVLPLTAATGAAASTPSAQLPGAPVSVPVVFLPAHAQLLTTAPEDGGTVKTATEVVLRFNEDVNPDFVKVVVKGPAGEQAEGDPVVDGTDVTQALVADLPAGTHEVAYRVVSTDGHPVAGTIKFTTTVAPKPSESPSASPSSSAAASSPAPSATPSPMPSPGPTADRTSSSGPSTGQWVAIAAGILGLLLIIAFLAARSDGSGSGGRSV